MSEIGDFASKGRFPYLGTMMSSLLLFFGIALGASQFGGWVAGVGVSILIFLSTGAVGAAFGFLFAVPRLLAVGAEAPVDVIAPAGADKGKTAPRLLRSNTNLERISDWLTTMLVGVGLSQVGSIGEALFRFRMFLADAARVFPDARGVPSAGILPAIGPMILIVGLVMGFLTLYLYTRIILSGSFNDAERGLANSAIERKPVSGDAADALIGQAKAMVAESSDPAVEKIAAGQTPLVGDGLDMMLNLLYQPDGYDRVIELAGELSRSAFARSGVYWFYLAAAFGQKHQALRLAGAGREELGSIRGSALDAAARAVALHQTFADRLWQIADPNGADNDLADFRNDPEFRRIVGRPIR